MNRADIKVGQTLLSACGAHIKIIGKDYNRDAQGVVIKKGIPGKGIKIGQNWSVVVPENYSILKNNTQIYEIF